MKKISLLFLFVLFACSSDDSGGPKPATFNVDLLLRGWAYDKIGFDGLDDYPHNPYCNLDHFGFRNRETQEFQFEEVIYTADYCASHQTFMRWEPDGDHVNFYFGKHYIGKMIIQEVTDTSLHCILEMDFNGDGDPDQQEVRAIPYDPYDSF